MKKQACTHHRRYGFTIVEVLVVVIIIAALATMIVPRFFGRIGSAKHGVARQKLVEIEKAIDMFSYEYGRLPESLDELVNRPPDIPEEKWNAPTLKAKDLVDPWDRRFIYKVPGDHGPYDLYSLGADGEAGGEKENADINNWE
ncbi:MAG: type II secretion system major pseudopilin GspG [Planctomycetota bacterium]|nr:type II secretion system major pseudopilin GspG [Planctomycetota bacterium]